MRIAYTDKLLTFGMIARRLSHKIEREKLIAASNRLLENDSL